MSEDINQTLEILADFWEQNNIELSIKNYQNFINLLEKRTQKNYFSSVSELRKRFKNLNEKIENSLNKRFKRYGGNIKLNFEILEEINNNKFTVKCKIKTTYLNSWISEKQTIQDTYYVIYKIYNVNDKFKIKNIRSSRYKIKNMSNYKVEKNNFYY